MLNGLVGNGDDRDIQISNRNNDNRIEFKIEVLQN